MSITTVLAAVPVPDTELRRAPPLGRDLAATREQGELAMGNVLMEITMSLDGYVTGPDVSPDEPMGRGSEAPHERMFAGKSAEEVNRRCVDYDPGR
jgi:hypothetical protein